jgi:hypothetical protein
MEEWTEDTIVKPADEEKVSFAWDEVNVYL